MSREKKRVFRGEIVESWEEAQSLRTSSIEALEKSKKACLIGLISTFLSIVPPFISNLVFEAKKGDVNMNLWAPILLGSMLAAIIVGIIAICSGGKHIVGAVWPIVKKIAFIGWFIIPVFPIDLIIGLVVLVYSVGALLFVAALAPWLLVLLARIKIKNDLKAAEAYIRQNGSNQ